MPALQLFRCRVRGTSYFNLDLKEVWTSIAIKNFGKNPCIVRMKIHREDYKPFTTIVQVYPGEMFSSTDMSVRYLSMTGKGTRGTTVVVGSDDTSVLWQYVLLGSADRKAYHEDAITLLSRHFKLPSSNAASLHVVTNKRSDEE